MLHLENKYTKYLIRYEHLYEICLNDRARTTSNTVFRNLTVSYIRQLTWEGEWNFVKFQKNINVRMI